MLLPPGTEIPRSRGASMTPDPLRTVTSATAVPASGLVSSSTEVCPAPAPTPFEATEVLRVDASGLLAYHVELGDRVRKGQPIADLIAMDGPQAFMARRPILAGTDGFVLSRVMGKYVARGASIAKVVGTEVLPTRAGAYLLED